MNWENSKTSSAFREENRISAGRRLLYRFHIDLPLWIGIMLLSAMGMVVLYSAGDKSIELLNRQFVRLFIAFIIMIAVAQINPRTLKSWAPWMFGIGLLMLIAVLAFGEVGKGAQRWLNLGVFRFQPSELMKIAVPIMTAWYLAEAPLPPRFGRLIIATIIVLVPTLLIAKQPDLGTALGGIACFAGSTVSQSGGERSGNLVLAWGDCFVVPPRKDMQFDIVEGVQFIKITFTDC